MNQQQFEAELQAGGYNPAVPVHRAAGDSVGEHRHAFDAYALITAGDITLVVDTVSTRYAEGETFRLPAGTPHHESVGPLGVTYLAGRREPMQS